MQRIGERDVVDEGAFAAQQLRIDVALNARSECRASTSIAPPSGAAHQLGGAAHRGDDVLV